MNNKPYYHYFETVGIPIKVHSNDRELLDAALNWMGAFAEPSQGICDRAIQICIYGFNRGEVLPFHVTGQAKCLFREKSAAYYIYKNLYVIEFEKFGKIVLNIPREKMLCLAYKDAVLASEWDFEEYMHPLSELLRRHRLYQYHSAAVCHDSEGILIIGKKGQGKSTLAIDLLDNGFGFLADDRCFLRETDTGIEVTGFHEEARIFPPNANHIKSLRNLEDSTVRDKVPFYPGKYYPEKIHRKTYLSYILFPFWSPDVKSSIEKVTQGYVLEKLLPSTMLCSDPEVSRSHFEFNCMLAENIPAARLVLGYDRHMWHELVAEFISSVRK